MSLPRNRPSCGVCGRDLVKNGSTSSGRTRWRCKTCGASSTLARDDITRRAQLSRFLSWLLAKGDPAQLAGSSRSFRRSTSWCWRIQVPPPAPTGEIHDVVMLDGTYFQGWCVLIATDGQHVIDWQWCDHEKKIAWSQILARWPAPRMIVIDGGSGLHSALAEHWPETRVQRCYFHIFQTVRRHPTLRPRLTAGQEIFALTKALMQVKDLDQAAAWLGRYAIWEASWDDFLRHRTYARTGDSRPISVPLDHAWWYTHRELRRVRSLFRNLIRQENLFAWLELADDIDAPLPRTTSPLEGAGNRLLKDVLREHRGMTPEHARRAMEWRLNALTATPHDPWDLARPEHWNPPPKRPTTTLLEDPAPQLGTSFSWEDGNGIQHGWAGRTRR